MQDSNFDLTGRGAIVTGGSSGIGLAIATTLAAAGATVALWGRDLGRARAAADSIEGNVVAVRCDVGEEADVVAALATTVETIGDIDVCIANAGVPGANTRFVDTPLSEFRRVTATDLDGVFLTFREAARHLIGRGAPGSLIAVSSIIAVRGEVRSQAYAAAKGGVISMVRACAVELGPHRIRVNAVLPGFVRTPLAEPMLEWAPFVDRTMPRIPLGRWGEPVDLGGVALYLSSDASCWHTGDVITIDGGFCAG